jgi:hypothetical protein
LTLFPAVPRSTASLHDNKRARFPPLRIPVRYFSTRHYSRKMTAVKLHVQSDSC